MGQRLVVTIKQENKDIAKIYYHWAAYTVEALCTTKDIIRQIYRSHSDLKNKSPRQIQFELITLCEANNGGVISEDYKYVKNMFPNYEFVTNGMNCFGLIALSESVMCDMQSWAEGDVIINLDTNMVNFCVINCYDSIEEYNENIISWDDEWKPVKLESIPDIGRCLWEFNVSDIDDIMELVGSISWRGVCRHGEEIYDLIS